MKTLKIICATLILLALSGCGSYNFTGTGKIDATTFQVNFFQNNAPLIEPGLDRDFTLALQDLILSQTNLDLVNANGDLTYEGEIIDYRITPMTSTSQLTANQNRLNMTVNVRFTNTKDSDADFEKRFSFFFDFGANEAFTGTIKQTAFQQIFERLTQDIFNESLAQW
jgi:hypothetical protein